MNEIIGEMTPHFSGMHERLSERNPSLGVNHKGMGEMSAFISLNRAWMRRMNGFFSERKPFIDEMHAWMSELKAFINEMHAWMSEMKALIFALCLAIAAAACGVNSPDTAGAVDGAGTDAAGSADSAGGQNVASADGGHEAALSGDSAVPGNTSRDGSSQDGASQDAARADAVSGDSGGQDSATQDAGMGSAAGTTIAMEVTFYGWADNSPPGNAIAYPANGGTPTIHNAAGGTGTYADPITFATAPTEFSPGTRVYVPFIEKYVVMEDSCGQCTTDWMSGKYHIDLWMNSNGTESATALMNCEGSWTRTETNVEVSPPPTRVVTTPPLFDPATNTCRTSP